MMLKELALQASSTNGAATMQGQKKLWGGRFTGATDPLMEKFNESLPFDKRMWKEDIEVLSQHELRRTVCSSRPLCPLYLTRLYR